MLISSFSVGSGAWGEGGLLMAACAQGMHTHCRSLAIGPDSSIMQAPLWPP